MRIQHVWMPKPGANAIVMRSRIAVVLTAGLLLAGCESHISDRLPRGAEAYKITPSIENAPVPESYEIIPGDEIELRVMDEPDLNLEKLIVDQSGRIQVPLIGSIQVSGSTPGEVSRQITRLLAAKYIRDPRVALNVTTPAVRYVSVEGQVTKAGAYPVTSDTTLLSAISMAQSPTRIARLNEVMIFRTKDGQRMAARFDLKRIRAGIDPDPQIVGGDVVVIGFSQAKGIYRDFLQMAPGLSALAVFKNF